MPCFYPIPASQDRPGGKVTLYPTWASGGPNLRLPCGGCVGCKLEKSRQWAMRMMHEASQHEENCLISLTYDDDHLPFAGTLVPEHMQRFMKRLRKRISPKKVRNYYVGEYGTKYGRPHYHVILFGFDFSDKVQSGTRGDFPVWTSGLLSTLWVDGRHELGSVTFDSAAYVARYLVGADSREVLSVSPDGEATTLQKEFARMSRRPGIGRKWYDRFGSEVYRTDGVVVNGRLCKPPRYYDMAVQMELPEVFEAVRFARRRACRTDLQAAEKHVKARLSLKNRELEE